MTQKTPITRPDFHLKVVQEISELINQGQGLEAILKEVAAKVAQDLALDVVSVYLWDPELTRLVMRASHGLVLRPESPVTLSPQEGLTGLVFEIKQPVVAMPASSHPRFKFFPDIGEERYESYIGVPILLGSKALGVLVGQIAQRRRINPAEETLFGAVASRLAGLMEVADRLERLQDQPSGSLSSRAFQGKGVSGGFATGPVRLFKGLFQRISLNQFTGLGPAREKKRLHAALAAVEAEVAQFIEELSRQGLFSDSELAIFQVHHFILRDNKLLQTLEDRILKENEAAEAAVVRGVEAIAQKFENQGTPMLAERAGDVREVGERLLGALLEDRGEEQQEPMPMEGSVIVARDLGPSYVARMGTSRPAAIVTTQGGETSHTSILAQSLGIPAVAGADTRVLDLKPGQQVLVDGATGFVFADPPPALVEQYAQAHTRQKEVFDLIRQQAGPADQRSPYKVNANIGFPSDVEVAVEYGLTDVGLFRTEFTFMRFSDWPDPQQQAKVYSQVAASFSGHITIRTLDIGADKKLPYFSFSKEENPLLGLRSIRFSMEYLDLFRQQVRGILLAGEQGHDFRILLPLISRIWELETAREILNQQCLELEIPEDRRPPLGVMLEVPGMVWQVEDFSPLIDFFSIGTNDLIQYALAVDRNSSAVGHLYSGYHPSVLRMLDAISQKIKGLDKEVTVCGEMAAFPAQAIGLCALGFTHFSVTPAKAPLLCHLTQRLDPAVLSGLRKEILSLSHEKDIRRRLENALEQIDPLLLELG